jgi:hypothetical protein
MHVIPSSFGMAPSYDRRTGVPVRTHATCRKFTESLRWRVFPRSRDESRAEKRELRIALLRDQQRRLYVSPACASHAKCGIQQWKILDLPSLLRNSCYSHPNHSASSLAYRRNSGLSAKDNLLSNPELLPREKPATTSTPVSYVSW